MPAGFNVKNMFFDRRPVIEALGRATANALSKAGAFVRTRGRSKLRRRKASAGANQPPSSHDGSLKDKTYFSFDPKSRSVVIGPERFKKGVAETIEKGGEETLTDKRGHTRRVTYPPHPWMGPALAEEVRAGTIPGPWHDSIK